MTDTVIEQGKHGLFYATDRNLGGVFIAAQTPEAAETFAEAARMCLPTGINRVPGHTLYDHASGARMTIPDPQWMTEAQRRETVVRLRRHLAQRMLS